MGDFDLNAIGTLNVDSEEELLIAAVAPVPTKNGGTDKVTQGAILVYGTDGELVNYFGDANPEGSNLMNPRGMAIGPAGKVYVADREYGYGVIKHYDGDGTFVGYFPETSPVVCKADEPICTLLFDPFGPDNRLFVNDGPPELRRPHRRTPAKRTKTKA